MKEKIQEQIIKVLKTLNIEGCNFSVEIPEDFKNGDYSSNVAMVYSKQLKISPKELAEKQVVFCACANAIRKFGIRKNELLEFVTVDSSGGDFQNLIGSFSNKINKIRYTGGFLYYDILKS